MSMSSGDMGDLIIVIFAVLVGIAFRITVWYRTRKANESTGCLACHAETLEYTDHGTLRCTTCGYEGDPERGGDISYQEMVELHGNEGDKAGY